MTAASKVSRSTMAVQSRGLVNVFVHPPGTRTSHEGGGTPGERSPGIAPREQERRAPGPQEGTGPAAVDDARFSHAAMDSLPFADGTFDTVLSVFGANLAADAVAVFRKRVRVCRAGGSVGLTTWTPDGFVGRLFDVLAAGEQVPLCVNTPPAVRQ